MIPSYFKIEIWALRDEFVTLGHNGLNHFLKEIISVTMES